jgi:methylthioxylose transferase
MAAMTVLAGQVIKAAGGQLGVFLPPFYIRWGPHVGALAAVSVAALLGAAAAAPRWIERARRPPLLAAGLFALAVSLGVSLNVARHGFHELWAIFQIGPHGSPEAGNEYLAGPPALSHGVAFYVAHFQSLFPSLPQKVTGNPPGPLIALHLLGISTPGALAALCIGTGALTAPLAYDLGRTLGGEQRGRVAGVLAAFAPSLLLWGVTSADYAFATLGLAAACLLVRDRLEARVAGALLAAIGSFFSWLLFAIPAWAVLVVLRREGTQRALALTSICAVATAVVYLTLALAWGYDPFAALKATDAVYRQGIAQMRPFAYWAFGSPVAWGFALGFPTAWALLRAVAVRDAAAVALLAVVLVGAVLGYTKAETERIWLPFVPLACVAAARALPSRGLRAALWLLVSQALAIELLFDTIW